MGLDGDALLWRGQGDLLSRVRMGILVDIK